MAAWVSTPDTSLTTSKTYSEHEKSTEESNNFLHFTTRGNTNYKKVQGKRIELNILLKSIKKKTKKALKTNVQTKPS
jgi:hypothetical protein